MKRKIFLGILLMIFCFTAGAQDPITMIIKEGITRVIRAVDLKIQRLQNKTIWLQNAQKVIENEMSKLKLNEISDWVGKQRKLYADYFDELWKVKSAIEYYQRVRDIIAKQLQLVREYKAAYTLFQQDKNFTPEELDYMHNVYEGILNESIKNLDQVYFVINPFATQMTDAKRLEIINAAGDKIDQNLTDLRQFNNQNKMLSFQRAAEKKDIETTKKLYGL